MGPWLIHLCCFPVNVDSGFTEWCHSEIGVHQHCLKDTQTHTHTQFVLPLPRQAWRFIFRSAGQLFFLLFLPFESLFIISSVYPCLATRLSFTLSVSMSVCPLVLSHLTTLIFTAPLESGAAHATCHRSSPVTETPPSAEPWPRKKREGERNREMERSEMGNRVIVGGERAVSRESTPLLSAVQSIHPPHYRLPLWLLSL